MTVEKNNNIEQTKTILDKKLLSEEITGLDYSKSLEISYLMKNNNKDFIDFFEKSNIA